MAVPVPVHDAQRRVDQARPRVGDVPAEPVVLRRPVEVQADRVGDVAEPGSGAGHAERLGDVQATDHPGVGRRLLQLHGDGGLDRRPRSVSAGAAELQVGPRECPCAVRRQQELERLPRRAVDGHPRLHVGADRRQPGVAADDRQLARLVLPDAQQVVGDGAALPGMRKPPAKVDGQGARRELPVEAANPGEQRGAQVRLNAGVDRLGDAGVHDVARRRREPKGRLVLAPRLRRDGVQPEQHDETGRGDPGLETGCKHASRSRTGRRT